MRKVDAVYSTLIAQFGSVCDDTTKADIFSEALQNDSERELFESLFVAFIDEKENLESYRDQLDIYPALPQLHVLINKFKDNFEQFPGFDYQACLFGLMIAERILQNEVSPLPAEDVDDGFDFFYCDIEFECRAFSTNLPTLNRNILWVNPSSIDSLTALSESAVALDLLYFLISVGTTIDFRLGKSMIVCERTCVTDRHAGNANVIALMKLHMVSSGNKITRSNLYIAPPQNSSQQNYIPANSYAQFSEVIHILGEYLDRKDVLAKFLSMYHVIENFMIKSQIVKLERKANGAMFSIRDFRRLNKAVDISEVDAIEKLVKSIFSLSYATGNFGDFALTTWRNFLTTHAASGLEIDTFLSSLINGSQTINSSIQFIRYFSTLIYQMRCSIVHNKETEFHISNETYSTGCRLVMEQYLLPTLEEFVFLAMAEDNDIVWYRSNSIKLWSLSA
ncbi:hypothetical protein [Pseudomonas sp. CC120222-01a]|uniref:hypothetical protein n=1 Tax=Pseudomonas sp. CC120222-01a TaxID=1378075 RepID=UPI000D91FF14|nr:hypothetical protein [Pseudomonas sp. CC120222-01a]PVZ41317.1 hypothetical protein N430_02380 [Pseudomonas sp. CC120222-01a]